MLHTVKLLHFIGKYKKQKGTSNFLLRGQHKGENFAMEIKSVKNTMRSYYTIFVEKGHKKLRFHPSNHFITEKGTSSCN